MYDRLALWAQYFGISLVPVDPIMDNLDRIKKLVVDPIVNELRSELTSVRRELVVQGERFEKSHAQLERSLTQTEALIRSAHDPQTGNITRPELYAMRDVADKEHSDIRRAIVDCRTDLKTSFADDHEDHENRIRAIERNAIPAWAWPAITALTALAGFYGGHIAWK